MSKHSMRWGALLLVAALCGACGKDDNNTEPGVKVPPGEDTNVPDAGSDASTPDATSPDVDAEPDADEGDVGPSTCGGEVCEPGYACVDGACKIVDSCEGAIDAGVLADGATLELTGSLVTHGIEDIEATCNATSLRDRVVTFELESAMIVDIAVRWVGQYDGVIELRTDCGDADSVVFCSDNENQTRALEAGVYHLVLDQKFGNAGTFEVSLTGTTAACTEDACVGSTELLRCIDPTAPVTLQCGDACNDAACDGSTCDNPIEVTSSGTYSGDVIAHGANYNFRNNAGCVPTDLSNPVPTPGAELVFYLPDLEVGDVIAVDTTDPDQNINAVFITKQCGDTAACSAAFMAETVEWTVDEAGGYYVIIDKTGATTTPFHYAIEVR